MVKRGDERFPSLQINVVFHYVLSEQITRVYHDLKVVQLH